jgi:protocatechuate 3,4-dioxygenase beta subunit
MIGTSSADPMSAIPALPPAPQMCILSPQQTEGPFYENGQMTRKDITEDRKGAHFKLRVRLVDVSASCKPMTGIAFEIWHCDAEGGYSGPKAGSMATFLRGVQMTDETGVAEFDTIYPGWYSGRAVHIHFKAHVTSSSIVTSQLYFDEDVTRQIYSSVDPYKARGTTFQSNASDGIAAMGYKDLMPVVKPAGDGYVGDIVIGVNMA